MLHLKGRHPRVLVVGDLMLDHYLWGTSDRISPEAPVPVVDVAREAVALGGAGNVINNLLALGARVSALSVVGDDPCGQQVVDMLGERGVAIDNVVVEPGRRTPRKTRLVVTHQQVARFDRESRSAIDQATETALLATLDRHEAVDAVLVSDYNKGLTTPTLTRGVIAWARARSIPVLVDPKGTDYSKYRGATLVTPNRKEAAQATGIAINSLDALRRAGAQLRHDLGLEHAIITLSDDGLAVCGDQVEHIRAVAREVYDVTGAGDTVLAALGFALACGAPIRDAAHFANGAAAVVVGKLGSATATFDEILSHQTKAESHDSTRAIRSFDEIESIAASLRRQGRKIVFTNGCFDLLHRGHVQYLQASRDCGDVLIVGLNSDASIRRNKGAGRPVVGQDDRAFLLASLRAVDHVVIFDEDTPLELIRRIAPDVLTKGADYAGREIVGSDLAGEVRLISFVEGRSTSLLIDRIRTAA